MVGVATLTATNTEHIQT